jgi:hypothetical protein
MDDIRRRIPTSTILNPVRIGEWCVSRQNVRKGKALLSAGFFSGLHILENTQSNGISFSGFAEAEKKVGKVYQTEISFRDSSILSKCVCLAFDHLNPCKHKCSLLFALIALRDYHAESKTPKMFKRPGASKMIAGLTEKQKESMLWLKEARLDWTWQDIISGIVGAAPSFIVTSGGNKRKIDKVDKPPPKRRKANKLYCYCQKEQKGTKSTKEWVRCQGKTKGCCGWYHITCLEAKEQRTLTRTKRNAIQEVVYCQICLLITKQ